MLKGARAAARRIANFATYYQMNARAGTVGSIGVAQMLRRVREQRPTIRLHLVGHSFGGQLVTAAASGPIIVTHTKHDRAVGIAFPLASRCAFQKACALGDANDPYGGMGRNGAVRTLEVSSTERTLKGAGQTYRFEQGAIYNLLADEFISDHGAVDGPEVAYAILSAACALQ